MIRFLFRVLSAIDQLQMAGERVTPWNIRAIWPWTAPPEASVKTERFVCPECGASSPNPNDIREGYCGRCHWWTGDPVLLAAWREERAARNKE